MIKQAKYAALAATMMLAGLGSTQAAESAQYDHAGNLVSGVVINNTGDKRLKEARLTS